jgi:hypothetical protein
MFAQSSITEWFSTFATSPWVREEVAIKILSALYKSPSGLFNQLIHTFSIITWLSIILSILVISIILIKTQISSHFTNKKLFKRDVNIVEIIILVSSYLLNNCQKTSDNFLITVWAFVSLIIITCISGNILSSIVNQDMTSINTFEELLNSNLSIIGGKYSHYQMFDNRVPGLEVLKKLHNKTEFIDDYDVS